MNMKQTSLAAMLALTAAVFGAEIPKFGAGEMENPGRTFYLSPKGNDKNDGKTPETAWRTFTKIKWGVSLRAGDTLLLDEGEYRGNMAFNVKDRTVGYSEQCGKPGAPIRIAGMPGKNAVLSGADFLPNPKQPVEGRVYEFPLKKAPLYNTVMESPSGIQLQQVFVPEIVKEIPGTYYFDKAAGRLLVHYAAEGQNGVRIPRYRNGIRIHGSWFIVENLTFKYYYEAIYARANMPENKNVAEHITIRNCKFFNNYKNGIVMDSASFSLITKNVGMGNGEYGTVMMMDRGHDNLYTGNWFGPGPLTLRQRKPYEYNFALNQYGGWGKNSVRNYVIGNVLEDKLSFRWKPQAIDARFEDNMCYGRYYAESPARPVTILRNWFGGTVTQIGIGDLWKDIPKGSPMVFKDNVRDKKDFKPENPIVFEAEKLRMKPEKVVFPKVTFKDVQVKFIGPDSAAICWTTPECDGWGSIGLREKGETKEKRLWTNRQGVRHVIGIRGLKPDTEYEYRLIFAGRRPEQKNEEKQYSRSFRTAKTARAPQVLEVGPGKLTLEEAALAAIPGDTVKLLPGKHTGRFAPIRSGTPEKPITLKGEPGAVIDGQLFNAPLIDLSGKSNFVVDGIRFERPESTARRGVIVVARGSNIIVRNCRSDVPDRHWQAGPVIRGLGCTNIKFINNICKGGDYMVQLGGKNITVSHNTIIDATMFSTDFWHAGDLTVTDNIFYRPCIPVKRNTALRFSDVKGKIVSDRNVFWSPVEKHPVGGTILDIKSNILKTSKTLEEWQKVSGMDKNSIHADPMFVDYKNGDFRLKEGSPAKGKGADLP